MMDGARAAATGGIGRVVRRAALRLRDSRRGGVATMMGVATPVLVGFMALAIDTTYWETAKLRMQAATDQAAQGAGRAYKSGGSVTGEAAAVLAANGYVNGVGNVSVAVAQPPTAGAYAGNPHAIAVTLTQPQRNIFSSVLGVSAPVLTATSVTAPPTSPGGGACIIALGTTGETVTINGSNLIDTQFCNFYNNSVDAGATRLVGGGTLKALNAYLVGDWTGSGFFLTGKSMQRGVSPVADPYAERGLPVVPNRCDANNANHNSSATYSAKADGFFVFCKGLKLVANSQTLTLNPGVYVIAGDQFTINSGWTINATNATIYFTRSSAGDYAELKVNGGNAMNLTPPTTGITRGIAVLVDPATPASIGIDFGGSTTLNVTGAIYAANSKITISGNNGASGCTQVVARAIETNGNNTFKHDCGGVGVSDPPGSVPALVLVQ
jgi:Flp pilus assembly protein TadG